MSKKEKTKKTRNRPEWFRRFSPKQTFPVILEPKRKWISFGLMGDTHLTSEFCDESAIRAYYRDIQRMGIHDIFHAGDIWEGCCGEIQVYRGQIHDVNTIGFGKGVRYVAEHYPKMKNMATHFILGNHDTRIMERTGANFGTSLAKEREDMNYLQPFYARVLLSEDPKLTMDLIHLAGGVPYTIGYAIQKYIRNVPPSKRADIYGFGHTHHHQHVSAEGDDESFLVGGWQHPSEYNIRRGAGSEIGGYRLRIKLATNPGSNPMDKIEGTFMRY